MKLKLEPALITYLQKVLKTAQALKLESIVIERSVVRGWNFPSKTIVMVDTNVPELPFDGIGISGVGKLLTRIGLLTEFTAECNLVNNYAMNIELKGKGVAIKYNCGNPNAIKSPRKHNDTAMWTMEFSPELIAQLAKAQGTMATQFVNIKSTDGVCKFSMMDNVRDTYEQLFDGHIASTVEMDDSLSFDFHYDASMLLTCLKNADASAKPAGPTGSVQVTIGQAGSMWVHLNTVQVIVTPQSVL